MDELGEEAGQIVRAVKLLPMKRMRVILAIVSPQCGLRGVMCST